MPKGSRTSVKNPIRMIAITGRPIHAASHICAAGRIEMKVIEMPASVPSMAARGVSLRMYGPTNAPIMHDDADHERPRQAGLPGLHRILGVQVDRQHDHEDDDEHVRHAGAVRQCRDVGAVLARPAAARGTCSRGCPRISATPSAGSTVPSTSPAGSWTTPIISPVSVRTLTRMLKPSPKNALVSPASTTGSR